MSDELRHKRSPYLTVEQHQVAEVTAQMIADEIRGVVALPLANVANLLERLVVLAEQAAEKDD